LPSFIMQKKASSTSYFVYQARNMDGGILFCMVRVTLVHPKTCTIILQKIITYCILNIV
jgi:hypothetical protein